MMRAHAYCLVWIVVAIFTFSAAAAEKYKVGEEVQILFHNEWIPAVVRETDKKGNVLCEFEFAASTIQRVMTAENIRRPYEADAIVRGRVWSDATGKYKSKPLC